VSANLERAHALVSGATARGGYRLAFTNVEFVR
jgi:hypothetical protein